MDTTRHKVHYMECNYTDLCFITGCIMHAFLTPNQQCQSTEETQSTYCLCDTFFTSLMEGALFPLFWLSTISMKYLHLDTLPYYTNTDTK